MDNNQSLLVSDAQLEQDLPDAMKLVMHLADSAKAALGRGSRTLRDGASRAVGFALPEDSVGMEVGAKEKPHQGKLAGVFDSVLRPVHAVHIAKAGGAGGDGNEASPPSMGRHPIGGTLSGVAELLRKTAALGRGKGTHSGEHEKAPLLNAPNSLDSSSSSPARGFSDGGGATAGLSGQGYLREVVSDVGSLQRLQRASSNTIPGSVELFSYLGAAKQQQQQQQQRQQQQKRE